MPETLLNEETEQSLVKATIVSKYFDAWANAIISTQERHPERPSGEIAYVDLFAGPGRYADGTQSTPILILKNAIQKPHIRDRLLTLFNDKDDRNTQSLEKAIKSLPGAKTLKHKPRVENKDIGEEIITMLGEMKLIPTLVFVDPWGYKGLSLRLLDSVLKKRGYDCIFFFNYDRINMGLNNVLVEEYMDDLFGEERVDGLRDKLDGLRPDERELMIVEELCQSLKSHGSRYTLPFAFKDARGKRTTHNLVFVSKTFHGYEIMKDIMAHESSSQTQGVPSFEYNPADFLPKQTLLFQLSRPLDDLKEKLLKEFAGQKLTVLSVYKKDNVDTPYIKKNYTDVLLQLEQEGKITIASHKEDILTDSTRVTFPG